MRTLIICAVLIAVASAQFFCTNDEPGQMECFETKPNIAFCMEDGTWICGGCKVKASFCSKKLKKSRSETRCTGPKPVCNGTPGAVLV